MCESCEVLNINGINCHETGCPDVWKSQDLECKWCGSTFKPEIRNQDCCSVECTQAYWG